MILGCYIVDFPGYIITKMGRVYSVRLGKYLINQDNGNGYKKIILYNRAKIKQVYLHRLVADAFIPNPNNYKCVDHIDRNKENNALHNLRWVSFSENIRNLGNKPRYSVARTCPQLPLYKRYKVWSLNLIGYRVMEISKILKIPRQTVSGIIKKESHIFTKAVI